jgi:hypothetical protein
LENTSIHKMPKLTTEIPGTVGGIAGQDRRKLVAKPSTLTAIIWRFWSHHCLGRK